jgi:hypothetical protein
MDIELSDPAGWAQVVVAILALIAGSATLSATWNRLRYRFNAKCYPESADRQGHSRSWVVTLKNNASTLKSGRILFYPNEQANRIVGFVVLSPNDGGCHVENAGRLEGSAFIDISRIAAEREIAVKVILQNPGIPRMVSAQVAIRERAELTDPTGRFSPEAFLATYRVRYSMLILLFILATLSVILSLINDFREASINPRQLTSDGRAYRVQLVTPKGATRSHKNISAQDSIQRTAAATDGRR